MKRIVKIGLAAVLLPVAALAVATVVTARAGDPALHPAKRGEETVDVYLVRNWLHANLAVPTAALGPDGPAARAIEALPVTDAPWVMLGWGDAKHYRERGDTRARALDLWRSLLVPDNPSVIAVEPVPETPSPETLGRPVLKLTLSRAGFERLTARLNRSFTLRDGEPVVAGRGRNPDALFFYSVEGADLFMACNHWVADLLHAAGVPTAPVVDTVTAGLAWDLRLRAGAEVVEGEIGERTDAGRETPPVYSGRFDPLSPETGGAVTFESYRIRFADGPSYETAPFALVSAAEPAGSGESWADLLDVPRDSLVETRRVLSASGDGGPCGAEAVRRFALGFRVRDGKRYEIALAAFSDAAAPCAVRQYVQP